MQPYTLLWKKKKSWGLSRRMLPWQKAKKNPYQYSELCMVVTLYSRQHEKVERLVYQLPKILFHNAYVSTTTLLTECWMFWRILGACCSVTITLWGSWCKTKHYSYIGNILFSSFSSQLKKKPKLLFQKNTLSHAWIMIKIRRLPTLASLCRTVVLVKEWFLEIQFSHTHLWYSRIK